MESAIAAAMPDYFERFEAHIYHELGEAIDTWGKSVTALAQWEDEHLLEFPTPEDLAAHRRTVDRLIRFGKFISLTTEHPDFPDPAMRELVQATLELLRDKIPLWHGTLPKEQAEAILKV